MLIETSDVGVRLRKSLTESDDAWSSGYHRVATGHGFGRCCLFPQSPARSLKHADLASQLMRASLSVPSNIAEGNGRAAAREVARFLDFAMGSLREVETLLELTDRLALVKKATIDDLLRQADETGRLLYGLRRSKWHGHEFRRPNPTSDV